MQTLSKFEVLLTINAWTRLATDLSLHLIPGLDGLRRMSQMARINAQCIIGNGFSLYCLNTVKPLYSHNPSIVTKISFPEGGDYRGV